LQEGEDPNYPADQFYTPPEGEPSKREVISEASEECVELHHFAFTRVRVTLGRDAQSKYTEVKKRELAALKANPLWFPHDLYHPERAEDGGPFTIGRVIHVGRSVGFTGYIGGIAVFDAVLSPEQMVKLAQLAKKPAEASASSLLKKDEIQVK